MQGLTFGLGLYTGQRPEGTSRSPYGDAVPLAQAAEEAGFDAFWVSEHHGLADGYLPSPLVVLGAVAAHTSRITLATGVVLAPLHDPIHLAEDAAVVDQLSGGRLLLGLGIGYVQHEYALLGSDWATRGARLEEAVEVLRRAWTGQPFSWHGRHLHYDGARVTPAAANPDGIPIWLGGYAPAAVARAGRIADGHLIGRGDDTIVAGAARTLAGVRDPDDGFTLAANLITVYDGPAGHGAAGRSAFARQQLGYERLQQGADPYAGTIDVGDGTGLARGSADAYLHLAGGADDIVERLERWLAPLGDWPHVHVVLRAIFPESDVAAQQERIAALGSDVLPRARALRASP